MIRKLMAGVLAAAIAAFGWGHPAAALVTGSLTYTPGDDTHTHQNFGKAHYILIPKGLKPFISPQISWCHSYVERDDGFYYDCGIRSTDAVMVLYTTPPSDTYTKLSGAETTFTSSLWMFGDPTPSTVTTTIKPVADLAVSAHVDEGVDVLVQDLGPSATKPVRVEVSGYPSKPSDGLPHGCSWSGLTAVCTTGKIGKSTNPQSNDSYLRAGVFTLPIPVGGSGVLTVKVSGTYDDPDSSNNSVKVPYTGRRAPTVSSPRATSPASGTTANPVASASSMPSEAVVSPSPSETAAPETSPAEPTPSTVASVAAESSSASPVWVAGGAALILLLAGGGWWWRRRRLGSLEAED